ncbi:MAG: hypothetical protein A2X13_07490 [Bacteroidetes bacterium GWC2_33_15]|nr:MAG: hypothetical protein A2X10_01345 [Bacteroidetes bacterium GWA2_33_15]OFX48630.1 MAG: hypothetical protein A2X13_07490 [Bacteroidetes bacterium GWC2_33_15]OFX64604.1 MAG: hypothetical protein A2X15_05080 [Bacteroidetes bacterium GWB2_32_14]OFX67978.1 MAG: hypothetical protein A2X14_01695 [Bacteroidetes bacterium GWD2_33_33]HAN18212.1 hypothetical protein [Bacteroidales bacterium]
MKKLLLLSVVCFVVVSANGQSISSSVVASAGGYSEAGEISLSWTLGELAVETFTASELILTQGFQQGYYEITGIDDPLNADFKVKVFPNPAVEFIYIQVENQDIQKIKIELYNMEGKLVHNEIYENPAISYELDISKHSSTQYILKITDLSGGLMQTYKIIKR